MAKRQVPLIGHIPLPSRYKLALCLSSFTLAALVVLYFFLTALVCYLTFHHLENNMAFAQSHPIAFFLYASLGIAGFILVFFMTKALLPQRPEDQKHYRLSHEQEPDFILFIEKIARIVGVPTPSTIEISIDGTAAIDLEGSFVDFFYGKYRLRIALPLLAGLNMSELGSLLAHEFGHCTQSWAMRMHLFILSSLRWFENMMVGRDSIDQKFEQLTQKERTFLTNFIRFPLVIGGLAKLLINLILRVLFETGLLSTRYLSLQMELHANRFEARMIGRKNWMHYNIRISKLAIAGKILSERLTDNQIKLSGYKKHTYSSLLLNITKNITDKDILESKTPFQWKGTDPTNNDNIPQQTLLENISSFPENGIFEDNRPAAVLFNNLDVITKKVIARCCGVKT
jgi:Zn-dependent protease with chaperone function